MPKITDEPLEAIQLRLFKNDLDTLREYYGTTVGYNEAIRTIVRTYVRNLRAKADKAIDDVETTTGPLT